MIFSVTMTTGWIALEPVEIPDAELERLWRATQGLYEEKGWGEPDRREFIHDLVFERIEQPMQKRLEAVEGISAIDFQESIIRDEEGKHL